MAHLMGMARMGTNEQNSVVDKNNKVHSVTNLFVKDGNDKYQNNSTWHCINSIKTTAYT